MIITKQRTSEKTLKPKPKVMTNRQRILTVLKGDTPDQVPFGIYEWKIPWGYDKRRLQERGLTMVNRYPGFCTTYPNCELKTMGYTENGIKMEREIVTTPGGEISALYQLDCTYGVRLQREFWIKSKEDYRAMISLIRDSNIERDYQPGITLMEALGEDGVVYIWKDYSPLQKIILHLIGMEKFCFELMDNPDDLWELYDALLELDLKKTPIVIEAPGDFIQYCANMDKPQGPFH